MDRSIMEGDPHSVIEAMALCGYCIGASEGLIYIRAEYPLAVNRLKIAIEQAREYGMLGKRIMGSEFDFELLTGHSSRVLELTQTLVGEQMEISFRYDFFEGTLTAVSFHVLGTR